MTQKQRKYPEMPEKAHSELFDCWILAGGQKSPSLPDEEHQGRFFVDGARLDKWAQTSPERNAAWEDCFKNGLPPFPAAVNYDSVRISANMLPEKLKGEAFFQKRTHVRELWLLYFDEPNMLAGLENVRCQKLCMSLAGLDINEMPLPVSWEYHFASCKNWKLSAELVDKMVENLKKAPSYARFIVSFSHCEINSLPDNMHRLASLKIGGTLKMEEPCLTSRSFDSLIKWVVESSEEDLCNLTRLLIHFEASEMTVCEAPEHSHPLRKVVSFHLCESRSGFTAENPIVKTLGVYTPTQKVRIFGAHKQQSNYSEYSHLRW